MNIYMHLLYYSKIKYLQESEGYAIVRPDAMPYPDSSITKYRITFLPEARYCMDKLGITQDEIFTGSIRSF
jgi:hypothetical protein